MASVEALEELRKELQQTQAAQFERIVLAEKEIVAIKAMEAPNLATIQLLTGTIEARVKAIEGQMSEFGGFVKTELLRIQDEAKGGGKGKSNTYFKKEIMESKAIQEIGKLATGTGYRKWLTKTKNLFEQARPGARKMPTFLEMIKEEETIVKMRSMGDGTSHADAIESIYNDKMESKEFQGSYEQLVDLFSEMDRDLWTILLEKTDGEAYDKVNSVIQGDGLWAFVKLHTWFSRTTEAGITNRLIAIMKPDQCKKEFEVAAAIEKREDN